MMENIYGVFLKFLEESKMLKWVISLAFTLHHYHS